MGIYIDIHWLYSLTVSSYFRQKSTGTYTFQFSTRTSIYTHYNVVVSMFFSISRHHVFKLVRFTVSEVHFLLPQDVK